MEDVDPHVLLFDCNVHLLGFRQDRHGRRGGVDSPLRLGLRDALHAVYAAFVLQARKRTLAPYFEDHLFEAALFGFGTAQDLGVPAFALGVAGVRPEELGREQRCLFAARSAPDLHDHVFRIARVSRQQLPPNAGVQVHHLFAGFGQLRLGHRFYLSVIFAQKRPRAGCRLFQHPVLPVQIDDARDLRTFPRQLRAALVIDSRVGGAHFVGQFVVSLRDAPQLRQDRLVHCSKRRPAHRGPQYSLLV